MKIVKNTLFLMPFLAIFTAAPAQGMNWFLPKKTRYNITYGIIKGLDALVENSLWLTLTLSRNQIIVREQLGTNQLIIVAGKLGGGRGGLLSCIKKDPDYEQAEKMWLESKDIFYSLLPKLGENKRIIIQLGTEGSSSITLFGSTIKISIAADWKYDTRDERMFVLAHEISHYLLGHVTVEGITKALIARCESQDTYHVLSQEQEKEADLNAVKMLGTAQGGMKYFDCWHRIGTRCKNELNQKLQTLSGFDKHRLQALLEECKGNERSVINRLMWHVLQTNQFSCMDTIRNMYALQKLKEEFSDRYRKPTTHPAHDTRVNYMAAWERQHNFGNWLKYKLIG